MNTTSIKHQPVSSSILRSSFPVRIALTFILQAVLKVAIWTLFTFSFVNKIQTNTSQKLFSCIAVMLKVAFFPSRTRPRRYKFKTQLTTISCSRSLPFLGDIISPILWVINTITRPLCGFLGMDCLLWICIWRQGSVWGLHTKLNSWHDRCWSRRNRMNKFLWSKFPTNSYRMHRSYYLNTEGRRKDKQIKDIPCKREHHMHKPTFSEQGLPK